MSSRIGSKIGSGAKALLQGDAVSSKFFRRHLVATTLFVLACLCIVAMRFSCDRRQREIASLKQQINVISTDKQKERSRYMTLTRESAMLHLVDSLKLGLTIPERRPEIVNPN